MRVQSRIIAISAYTQAMKPTVSQPAQKADLSEIKAAIRSLKITVILTMVVASTLLVLIVKFTP